MMFLGGSIMVWDSDTKKDYKKQLIKVVFDPRRITQGEYLDTDDYNWYDYCREVRKFMIYELNMDFAHDWDVVCYKIELSQV
jgi:hypothetical protein